MGPKCSGRNDCRPYRYGDQNDYRCHPKGDPRMAAKTTITLSIASKTTITLIWDPDIAAKTTTYHPNMGPRYSDQNVYVRVRYYQPFHAVYKAFHLFKNVVDTLCTRQRDYNANDWLIGSDSHSVRVRVTVVLFVWCEPTSVRVIIGLSPCTGHIAFIRPSMPGLT